jgi:DNA-binding transcriptional ArsR family regulator
MSKTITKFEDRYVNLTKDKTRYGIIMAIKIYGSLNLKKLSDILGKSESTIFHHLTELRKKPSIVEMDHEINEIKRGKYFKLSNNTLSLLEEDLTEIYDQEIPEILDSFEKIPSQELYNGLINYLKQIDVEEIVMSARKQLAFYHNIENFIINNYDSDVNKIKKGLLPKRIEIPISSINNISQQINVFSSKHVLEIAKLINEFFSKLNELQIKIQGEIENQGIKEKDIVTTHLHLFGGELGEFPFKSSKN